MAETDRLGAADWAALDAPPLETGSDGDAGADGDAGCGDGVVAGGVGLAAQAHSIATMAACRDERAGSDFTAAHCGPIG